MYKLFAEFPGIKTFRQLFDSRNRLPSEGQSHKAKMIFDLVPQLYLQGAFTENSEVEEWVSEIEPTTKLSRKVLLARAISGLKSENQQITLDCQNLGRDDDFCKIERKSDGSGVKVIINTLHPALNFSLDRKKIRKNGGVDLDPLVGLELLSSLANAQVLLENPQTG